MAGTAETLANKLVSLRAATWAVIAARNHGFVSFRAAAEHFKFDDIDLLLAITPPISCQCRKVFDEEVLDDE